MLESIDAIFLLPIKDGDRLALEAMLNEGGLPICGNYENDSSASLIDYMRAHHVQGQQVRAVFDRNLISPLVRLAKGEALPEREVRVGRLACAAMAFCIWSEIVIEPSMAFYEYASSDGHDASASEIPLFRIIDNFDPEILLDYALGRIVRLPGELLAKLHANANLTNQPLEEQDLGRRLRLWRPHYLYALKTIDLLRSHKSSADAAVELMRWQAEEAFGAAAANSYCIAAMSHVPPKGGMLKQVRSTDPARVQAGAKNATWDILLLQDFGRRVMEEGGDWWSRWTDDIALRRVTDWMFCKGAESVEASLERFFRECWGKDSPRLLSAYRECLLIGLPIAEDRERHVREAFARVPQEIEKLERKLGFVTLPNT